MYYPDNSYEEERSDDRHSYLDYRYDSLIDDPYDARTSEPERAVTSALEVCYYNRARDGKRGNRILSVQFTRDLSGNHMTGIEREKLWSYSVQSLVHVRIVEALSLARLT